MCSIGSSYDGMRLAPLSLSLLHRSYGAGSHYARQLDERRRCGPSVPPVSGEVCCGAPWMSTRHRMAACPATVVSMQHGTGKSLLAIAAEERAVSMREASLEPDSGKRRLVQACPRGHTGAQYPRYW